ncbi:hypothetical protein DFO58_2207 [Arthrobacter sp. AG1021]|uniref:phage tail tube protein n=1 Tax=Arthrobacter sp. AG1021 TaxID=2183908 RepID=UPI000F16D6C1|nr:hypothetical protein [Arthrobacter sp. AG1021]RKS19702.1 hypothetical protein DFO58_2207 [Arthrobacter sp. AG1021]
MANGPKMLNTANRKLAWVPTIANPNAPTVAELTAGKDITMLVTRADYQFGVTGNEAIVEPALGDDIDAGVPGNATVEAAMNFYRFRNTADDTAWTTFTQRGLYGYLVERIGQIEDGERQDETPFAAADQVQVLYAITNDPQNQTPANAGFEKFRMTFSPQRHYPRAVVAATGG